MQQSTLLFDNKYLFNLIGPLLIETLLSVTIGMITYTQPKPTAFYALPSTNNASCVSILLLFEQMRHHILPIQLLSKGIQHEIKKVSSESIMELKIVCVVIDPINIRKQDKIVHL